MVGEVGVIVPECDEKSIFNAARRIAEPKARCLYLGQACGHDTALRSRVEALLRIHEQEDGFLESPAGGIREAVHALAGEGPGAIIGPYKLLEEIGEGGFGVVFLAEQQYPVRRRVALKVVKPGMDTKHLVAHFEAERQALALMDHPHIARVFDGGETESGRPYFVMELVRGDPVTEFCDRNCLPLRERLGLFVSICQAVQHAHHKGIIHRDLKPSNVLVTTSPRDGDAGAVPTVKVIDFGVAKATGQRLTDKTLFTTFVQLVGTPLYMSPEQVEMGCRDVDTRTDIYALGVLLYELMTGTTPFDRERLRTAGFDELRRIIREEDPPRPSTRLRSGEGRALPPSSSLQELDWIVMKALEKDRARRYDTAGALAQDIRRYLNNEPVEACPPGAGYRLRKFLMRNKGRVLAAALVLLALLAGTGSTTWAMIREWRARRDAESARLAEARRAEGERRAKEEAQKRLAQVEKGAEILASVFGDLDPQAAEKEGVALRALLSRRLGQAALELDGETVGEPLAVARLQHVLGISLRESGHLDQAEGVLVKACQTRERLRGGDDLETVATKHDLALLYRAQGKYAPAERLYKEVVATRTAKLGANHRDTLTARHCLAILYYSQGRYAQAEKLYQEVLARRTAQLGAAAADTLASKHWLALLYRSRGKIAEAEALYKEVLAVRTTRLGAGHLDTVAAKGDLAALYRDQRKYDQAAELWKEELAVRTAKLGADHPDTLTTRHQLAILYHYQGNSRLAETLQKEVLALRTARLGGDHPHTLKSLHYLAALYRDLGSFAAAEALYKQLLAVRTAKLGAGHPETLYSEINLAGLYRSQRRFDLAIPLLEETLRKVKLNPDFPAALTLETPANLGMTYLEAGRFADAVPLLEHVYEKGSDDPPVAGVGDALVQLYDSWGKPDQAARWRKKLAQSRQAGK
jgi:serine/threonine protein kinase/tetratricopeptide (TPR) repeat protein